MVAGRVAVVGAGLAGLSAALQLKKYGYQVDLFERSRLLGGKATSFEVEGVEVDNGQHVFLACCEQFIDFVNDATDSPADIAGLTRAADREAFDHLSSLLYLQPRFEALLLRPGQSPLRLRARNLPVPFHLASSLLTYSALSLLDRVRLASSLRAARLSTDPSQTFADWLDRHHQSSTARRCFWEPFLVPALNAALDQVSAEDALFVIRTAFLSSAEAARFGFSLVPLARIAEAAATHVDNVHLKTAVVGVRLEVSGGDRKATGIELEGGEVKKFDGLVLAVPPNRLARLLGNPEEFGIHGLGEFRFAPIIDVHLWYDVASVGFSFAAVLGSPVQWIFEKAPGYVACSMSAAHRFISMTNQELIDLADAELRRVLPILQGTTLVRGATTRDREATFVPTIGLKRPGNKTAVEGLTIAGAWTDTGWPATMESAVRSGRAAAKALFASMNAPAAITALPASTELCVG